MLTSVVQIFESNRNGGLHILVTLLSSEVSETKEIGEWIEAVLLISLFSLFHALFTLHIVHTSLVIVRKTFVSCTNIVPLLFAFIGLTLIRVIFQSQFSICLLDFAARSVPIREFSKRA